MWTASRGDPPSAVNSSPAPYLECHIKASCYSVNYAVILFTLYDAETQTLTVRGVALESLKAHLLLKRVVNITKLLRKSVDIS